MGAFEAYPSHVLEYNLELGRGRYSSKEILEIKKILEEREAVKIAAEREKERPFILSLWGGTFGTAEEAIGSNGKCRGKI